MNFILGPKMRCDKWRFSGQAQLKWTPHFKVSGCKGQGRRTEGGEEDLARVVGRKRASWGFCAQELTQDTAQREQCWWGCSCPCRDLWCLPCMNPPPPALGPP